MNTWEVVLAHGNDERHYYPETKDGDTAIKEAKAEWTKEFGLMYGCRLVAITKKSY